MNKYIKILILLLFTLSSLSAVAQQRKQFTPEHEFRLSIGAFNMSPNFEDNFNSLFTSSIDYYYPPLFSNENYDNMLYYDAPRTSTGAISAGYSYNVLKWLSVGAMFTYSGVFDKQLDRITKKTINKLNTNNFALTPMVRFNYLNTPMVRLYSQIGVGLGLSRSRITNGDVEYDGHNKWFVSGQVTFLGVSVGRKFFGFAELLGFGSQGAIVFGVGYKFNDKKHN